MELHEIFIVDTLKICIFASVHFKYSYVYLFVYFSFVVLKIWPSQLDLGLALMFLLHRLVYFCHLRVDSAWDFTYAANLMSSPSSVLVLGNTNFGWL